MTLVAGTKRAAGIAYRTDVDSVQKVTALGASRNAAVVHGPD
jgi:hypothetical protein